jgi:hypothetical protein
MISAVKIALNWILNNQAVQWALGILVAMGALKARDWTQRREGRKLEREDAEEDDAELADDIRRRARAARGERVQLDEDDDTGYRD